MRSWRCSRNRARPSSDSVARPGRTRSTPTTPRSCATAARSCCARARRSGSPRRRRWASGSSSNGIPVLARLEAPALADGGDLLWLDSRTLVVGRGLPHQRRRCSRDQECARALRRRGARRRPADRPRRRLLPAHAQPDLDARPRPRGGLAPAHARASLRAAARARRRADRDRRGASGTPSRPTCSRSARATS